MNIQIINSSWVDVEEKDNEIFITFIDNHSAITFQVIMTKKRYIDDFKKKLQTN